MRRSHLQEEPLVLAAIDLLSRLDELLGGVQRLTTSQQLTVQGFQLALLLLLQPSRPLVIALRQGLQHVVVVLLQVLLLTAEIVLWSQRRGYRSEHLFQIRQYMDGRGTKMKR